MKLFSHLFRLVIIIAFCYTIAGCCLRIQQPLNEKVLMPLRVGNWWKARCVSIHYNNESLRLEEVCVVMADTSLHGGQWYVMSDSSLMANTPDGVRRRIVPAIENKDRMSMLDGVVNNEYELKMPRQVGDTVWSQSYSTADSNSIRYSGIAEKFDTLICVSSGKFRCFMVRTYIDDPGTSGFSRYWRDTTIEFYAPGFGKVKEECGNGDIVGWSGFTWELIDYEIQ
jgi:hypothetical protein